MDDSDNTMHFCFEFSDGERAFKASFSKSADETWPEVVREFNNFLSAVYGYRIDELDAVAEGK